MLLQESLLRETLHSKDKQDTTDEADEALSLCDLPLYGDRSVEEWEEDLSAESQGSSSLSSSHQDYFEFSSQELSPSAGFPPETIIFCGKLIPYKRPNDSEEDTSKLVETKKQASVKKPRGWSVFRWKFGWGRSGSKRQIQSKNGKKSTTLVHEKGRHGSSSPKKTRNSSSKHGKGNDFPVQKMSVLTSSSSGKARWYLFVFGISRFSTELDIKDIKNRQSRRRRHPPPSTTSSSMSRSQNHDKNVGGRRNIGSSGLWGLIKILSCGGNQHAQTMALAPESCNPE